MQDHQPKHRQLAKEHRKSQRERRQRTERGAILIVCEGKRTEPYYLSGLRTALNVPSARAVIIDGKTDSDAIAVIRRARERFQQTPDFDRVFALIDAEQHNLSAALDLCTRPVQRANHKRGLAEIRVEPIVSTPCFEYWLLLHLRYTDQPFANFCEVLYELQADLPDYNKSDPRIFAKVGGLGGLDRACTNEGHLKKTLKNSGARAPDTDFPRLVDALAQLAG